MHIHKDFLSLHSGNICRFAGSGILWRHNNAICKKSGFGGVAMIDNKGQVSLEYLLIFAISLILLIAFTLPLTELTIENTLDVSDALNIKSDLSKISQAIEEVYGQGQGSKQRIDVVLSKDLKVNIASDHISCNLKLKDGQNKAEKIYFKSTLEKSSMQLRKGENSVIVEWPENSENMQIYVN